MPKDIQTPGYVFSSQEQTTMSPMSMQEEQDKSTGRFLNTFVNEGPVVTINKGKGMITSAT